MRTQFDQIASQYRDVKKTLTRRFIVEPTFLKLIGSVQGKKVLDLACGEGHYTRLLKKKGASKVYGIDLSRNQIKISNEIENKNKLDLQYFVGDGANFIFSKIEKLDLITAVFLLHYADSKEKLFKMCKNIYDALNENGKFVTINGNPDFVIQSDKKYEVTTSAESPLQEGTIRRVNYFFEGKELCSFDTYIWKKETYQEALKKAGFVNIKWLPVIVSKEGNDKFGKQFWKDFLANPYIIGLTCEKE